MTTDHGDLAELVRAVTLGVDGVLDLAGGVGEEIAALLPGGRVAGVRLEDGAAVVRIVAAYDTDLRALAARVRREVLELSPATLHRVDVLVDDVRRPDLPPDPTPEVTTTRLVPVPPAPAARRPR
ncbi:hypothetical protein [Litorihabitans aurantiacus]|uniref:Asp23/Gls24 family envelope stress response protein n=1 Tax=Litorihabitans aurantiacus TaxID=1930061 RepID=A0AA37XF73_9MICO|nr:hypothetical protein [Litorihabitans aurantiacus]GMA31995.1 hypothetical protein GCM10025875_19870 [Litorihabitans aurantiacus]